MASASKITVPITLLSLTDEEVSFLLRVLRNPPNGVDPELEDRLDAEMRTNLYVSLTYPNRIG